MRRLELKDPVESVMIEIVAHITHFELPAFWLSAAAGFLGGVAVTLALLARKLK